MKQNAHTASSPDTLGSSRQVNVERQGGAHYVAPLLGDHAGIGDLTVNTMRDALEARDDCGKIYRKSLLYLIFHVLEPQRRTPILGLEESLRADSELSRMFSLSGGVGRAEVIWSQTRALNGRSASYATSHGGFDDDPSTMGSIARRILGRDDHEAIAEYPTPGVPAPGPRTLVEIVQPGLHDREIRVGGKRGARRALCVGINDYPARPLAGCLADVESWSAVLEGAGFSVSRLLDRDATRANIVAQLEGMIAASSKGDVIVFQYSGHGTELPDLNGDEKGGPDQALVPWDYKTGDFLLDDDLGQIYAQLPEGVNLTCFMDCCHSGTNSRVFLAESDERPRFLPLTADMVSSHRYYREHVVADADGARAFAAGVEPKPTFEVSFAACSKAESAWESRGQGEFTVRATAILAQGLGKLTNAGFIEKVRADFGEAPRQHVQLDRSHRAAEKGLLLQPLVAAPASVPEVKRTGLESTTDVGQLVELLQRIEQLLQQGQLQLTRGRGKAWPNGGLQVPPGQSLQSSGEQNR